MKTIAKKVYHRILSNLYQLPYVQNSAELDYLVSLEKHKTQLPVLSDADQALVETLKDKGFVRTSFTQLLIPSTHQMLKKAQSLMLRIPKSISTDKSEYVVHATSAQIMEHLEIFLWGLEQRLLNIVENYLGLPVAYHGAYFRRDLANNVQHKSRLWHLDKEDRKMLKIIVYLSDVNDDGGPFEYIPKSLTHMVAHTLSYNYGYVQQQTMERVVSPLNWQSCTGPAGTVLLVDTACLFHRGKIPVFGDRFTIFYDYTTRQPKHPFYCKSSLSPEHLVLLASQLGEKQRQCLLWH
jgi:hypothetical protein